MNETSMIPIEWLDNYAEDLIDRGMPNMAKVIKRMIIAWEAEQDDSSSIQQD